MAKKSRFTENPQPAPSLPANQLPQQLWRSSNLLLNNKSGLGFVSPHFVTAFHPMLWQSLPDLLPCGRGGGCRPRAQDISLQCHLGLPHPVQGLLAALHTQPRALTHFPDRETEAQLSCCT